ncbi:class I glutamine amidotransferase-like protein [Dioszegia hungarica]|uniref:D-lactate dehydratase n=1 Tax=Dioszegia hungarica TaxID=4972 RepID=A0AA38H836_9TREE|nr:class I glutamine amidotransferase-like protein [Dioszegia hungarica]KAI9635707.1 class I glutamine amidotransferase-like protein [Dioszegia hungarica]
MSSQQTILFIFTSADKLLNGAPTGWYVPEAAHPYYALKPHFNIDSASTKGGAAPVDQSSVENFKDDESVKFMNSDAEAKKLYTETKKISEVDAKDYAAIFVIGGHGPMIDLAEDKAFAKLVGDFYAAKKPVSAVCHGPAALVSSKTPSGDSILKGAEVTGFSNAEEAQTPYNDFVNILPFSLEDRLSELSGGKYTKAKEDWGVKVVWDQGILTGQNPASAKALGEKLAEILQKA